VAAISFWYYAVSNGCLYLGIEGESIWTTGPAGLQTAPAVKPGLRKVWAGSATGDLLTLDAETGKVLKTVSFSDAVYYAGCHGPNLVAGLSDGSIFAIDPGLELTRWSARINGPVMAAGNRLILTVKGHSGHAALPHMTRDPMVAAAHLLLALQTIVSRNVDPLDSAVITIGVIQAGSAANQIPGEAVMRGTTRSLRNSVRDQVEAAIHRVAAGVAHTFEVEIDVQIPRGNPVTLNTPAERDLAAEAVTRAGLPLRRDMAPAMTGEDFAWYLEQRPGAFVWIGNGPADGGRELHNSNYNYNDAILPTASSFLAGVAKQALGD